MGTTAREEIVKGIEQLIDPKQVVTDPEVLKESSIDRYRKYESINGVFTQPIPAAVVQVRNTDEVSRLLAHCNERGINVVPRTGASGTERGIETSKADSIVIDGSPMNQILSIDTTNMLATAECGVTLEVLENRLRSMGYTTGHSPQSKPLAQMGGLVATRSIGQFSTLYGGIEDMVVGLEAVFPNGHVARIKNVPRRAAGPDIRHVVIGNEGALAFITEVTVKIFRYYPENHKIYGFTLDSMRTGFAILREIIVNGYRPSITRLYDPEDADYHFGELADGRCMLVLMAEGPKGLAIATAEEIERVVAEYEECSPVDPRAIQNWFDNLNWDPKKVEEERIEIAETQNIGFTTEVSGNWDIINDIYENCIARIRRERPHLTMVGGHASHTYLNGTNLYFMYYYNIVDTAPEHEITKLHDPINAIIVEETLRLGGSMVHHHGVGKARVPWIREEHGSAYYILEQLKLAYDPKGIMNAGTIWPVE